jgi:hypothetical protein
LFGHLILSPGRIKINWIFCLDMIVNQSKLDKNSIWKILEDILAKTYEIYRKKYLYENTSPVVAW